MNYLRKKEKKELRSEKKSRKGRPKRGGGDLPCQLVTKMLTSIPMH